MHAAQSRSYPPEGLCMPHRASNIHLGACACRTQLVISVGGPVHAAKSRSYPPEGLCMPHMACTRTPGPITRAGSHTTVHGLATCKCCGWQLVLHGDDPYLLELGYLPGRKVA